MHSHDCQMLSHCACFLARELIARMHAWEASREEFLAENVRPHPLFDPANTPGGGLSLFQPDWMHVKCLGTDQTLLGSCLAYLAKEVLPEDKDANMASMWATIQAYYKEHRTANRLSRLTFSMVDQKPFPRLAAKAVETRDLLPAVESILKAWTGRPLCAWFHRLVVISTRLDGIVFGNKGYILSVQERGLLRSGVFEYNQLLTRMAHHFHSRGLPYCNYTLKNHYLCHIGLQAGKTGVSPRVAFCFQGEDFMSVLKTLCRGSNRGVDSAKLVDKVVGKYLRGLDLLLGQMEQ